MIFLPKLKNGSIIEQNMENFGFPGISREISMISREFPVSRELEKSGKYEITTFEPKRWFSMKVRKEKKFISPISCIREKFHLQNLGVVEVFLY